MSTKPHAAPAASFGGLLEGLQAAAQAIERLLAGMAQGDAAPLSRGMPITAPLTAVARLLASPRSMPWLNAPPNFTNAAATAWPVTRADDLSGAPGGGAANASNPLIAALTSAIAQPLREATGRVADVATQAQSGMGGLAKSVDAANQAIGRLAPLFQQDMALREAALRQAADEVRPIAQPLAMPPLDAQPLAARQAAPPAGGAIVASGAVAWTLPTAMQKWFSGLMGGGASRSPAAGFGMPAVWAAFKNPAALVQQAMLAASHSGLAMAGQGTADLQTLIDEHNQQGDPRGAIDLEIQNVQARLAQSQFNLHQLSSEPGAGGGYGAFPGADDSAYFATLDTPLTREIKNLQAQLNQLLAQRGQLAKSAPRLATGGVVTDPTLATIGEAGPEAVIPLNQLERLFGNPANLFAWRGGQVAANWQAGQGDALVQRGLSQPMLANFDQLFDRASRYLSTALDRGLGPAGDLLDRWTSVQQSAEQTLDTLYNSRRINLQPLGGAGGGYDPLATSHSVLGLPLQPAARGHTFNLHMNVSQALSQQHVAQAFDWFEAEAQRRGIDAAGRGALRRPASAARGPLTPAGVAR
jgi:hypothetical protein